MKTVIENLLAEYNMSNSAFAKDLREALAEQPSQQEPVGSLSVRYHRGCKSMTNTDFDYNGELPEGDYELYTRPPAQRKPLTDEKIGQDPIFRAGVRFAEAAHGIKG